MDVTETRDKKLLRDFFRQDPIGMIYQWGDLQSPAFEQCRWFAGLSSARLAGLVLLYSGLETPSVLPYGDARALASILERFRGELPPRFHTKLTEPQRGVFSPYFRFLAEEPVTVMGLEQHRFQPAPPGLELRLLSPSHPVESLLRLYQDYPENYFERSHLQTGMYAAGYLASRLATVAGTHAYAPTEGVAVLGNIVTAVEFRGQGFCQACTSFLIEELHQTGCTRIALHVASDNRPAIACYEKVGFTTHSTITQLLAERTWPVHGHSPSPAPPGAPSLETPP